MELAKREEQAVAKVGRQLGQIQNCYHFHSKLCDNGFESEKRERKRDSEVEEMIGFLTNPLFGILIFFFSNSFFC